MGFGSLQHIRDRRSAHAGTPTRHVPPSGFGYPPGGLLPSVPCRFSFTPAALLGFTLRSVLLSKGIRGRYRPDGPTYRFAYRCSRRRSDGPAQQASVPGLLPLRESLASGKGLVLRSPDAPLGFRPFRVLHRRPRPRFRPNSSLALCVTDRSPPHRRPRVSQPPTRTIRSTAASYGSRTGRPF
jgi:hypothetical protein